MKINFELNNKPFRYELIIRPTDPVYYRYYIGLQKTHFSIIVKFGK